MVGLISAPKHAYDGCGEGAGTGASVGFDVGTCEKSNGDHRRALPESELCAVRCAYAVRRPSTRRRSPMTQAMYRSWFLHRDTHTTAEGSGPGTARSWACSSGCTTCADDKVAKRPHATRRLADSQVQVIFRLGRKTVAATAGRPAMPWGATSECTSGPCWSARSWACKSGATRSSAAATATGSACKTGPE